MKVSKKELEVYKNQVIQMYGIKDEQLVLTVNNLILLFEQLNPEELEEFKDELYNL